MSETKLYRKLVSRTIFLIWFSTALLFSLINTLFSFFKNNYQTIDYRNIGMNLFVNLILCLLFSVHILFIGKYLIEVFRFSSSKPIIRIIYWILFALLSVLLIFIPLKMILYNDNRNLIYKMFFEVSFCAIINSIFWGEIYFIRIKEKYYKEFTL